MATTDDVLKTLVSAGQVSDLSLELKRGQFADRKFFGTKRFWEWYESVDDTVRDDKDVSPLDDLDILLESFVLGQSLDQPEQIHPMNHVTGIIWVLKTFDLRIYGAFPKFNTFLAYQGYPKERVEKYNLYRGVCNEAEAAFKKMGLDVKSFIKTGNMTDVIST